VRYYEEQDANEIVRKDDEKAYPLTVIKREYFQDQNENHQDEIEYNLQEYTDVKRKSRKR
jgi:hypothetical protein